MPCGRIAIDLNTAATDCIALTGNGTTVPLEATPILDPDPENQIVCGPAGLFAPCQADLFAEGGVPAGSMPPIPPLTDVTGPGPDWPDYGCSAGFLTPYGPQADVLLTNPTDCSFTLWGDVYGSPSIYTLDVGATFQCGWAFNSLGVNVGPAPITFPAPLANGGVRYENNGVGTICTAAQDEITPFPAGFITLTPGDFIWFSILALVRLSGSGPSTTVTFVSGIGPQIRLRGSRL